MPNKNNAVVLVATNAVLATAATAFAALVTGITTSNGQLPVVQGFNVILNATPAYNISAYVTYVGV